jgi:multisubunit Na+/H+ antiporter MnhG subunit
VFGDDILAQLVLALGAALAAGSALALVRPPQRRRDDADLPRAPLGRSLAMIAVGLVAAVWALVTLATT